MFTGRIPNRSQGVPADATLPELVHFGAARTPQTPIIVCRDDGRKVTVTSEQLVERAAARVPAFWEAGCQPGDRVAVRGGATLELIETIVATQLAGLVCVPLLPVWGERDVELAVRATSAALLVSVPRWRNHDLAAEAVRVAAAVDGLAVSVLEEGPVTRSRSLRRDAARPAPHDRGSPDACACILHTSGSAGAPKGVLHSHRTIMAEAFDFASELGLLEDGGSTLQSFPIAHIGGIVCVFMSLVYGIPTVFLESWRPELAAEAISRHRVTGMGSTPFFVRGLLDEHARGADLSSLRRVMSGGAVVAPALVEEAGRIGLRVYRAYGSTEHPTATSAGADADASVRSGTDGRPTNGTKVRTVDRHGTDCPVGVPGEILLQGPEQCLGYWNQELPASDGWFRTGDIGVIDATGRLSVTGRLKDIIIRGGENISIVEVEAALTEVEGVVDAAAVPVADQRYGERVCALLVLENPGSAAEIGLDRIQAHFQAVGLTRYKTPELIRVVPSLPRNSLGKLVRAELPALATARKETR